MIPRSNLNRKLGIFSLCSVVILLSGCDGFADAKNPQDIALLLPQKLEAKPPNYRPIPRRYERVSQKQPAESSSSNPAISKTSNKAQIALARHLRKKQAKFYGAWWCPHCHEQKELFGKEAFKFVKYVECADRTVPRQQTPACTKRNIRAYPTWTIRGKRVEGVQSLKVLADLSGYRGSRNFPSP